MVATGSRGLEWIAGRVAATIARDPKRPNAGESLYRVVNALALIQWAFPPRLRRTPPGSQGGLSHALNAVRNTHWFETRQMMFYDMELDR